MELFKLDPSNQFKPSTSVSLKSTDTLVWTEKYRDPGDFTILIEDDVSILSTLPKGTLISHTDTTEVMRVENHEIDRGEDKKLKITVTGRSFDTFSENRVTAGCSDPLYDGAGAAIVQTMGPDTAVYIAGDLLVNSLGSGASSDDTITSLYVDVTMRDYAPDMTQIIERGDVYTRVMELMTMVDAGIKTIRPTGGATTMNLVIHDGIDRTGSVVFYAALTDLTDAKYLSSIKGSKNYASVSAKTTARRVRDRLVGSTLTGLDRKVMYVAAEDLEGDYDPGAVGDELDARGQGAISQNSEISIISATISKTARPKFKVHYDVGDLVTVFGEFDLAQIFRVTEHILTFDKTGMSGYPSLSAL